MILFNMCGGPDVGKTTFAVNLFAQLKIAGFRAELAREVARRYIYEGAAQVLADNQFLITAEQYEEVFSKARAGFEVTVSESPMILGTVYGRMNGLDYIAELEHMVRKLEGHFETYNVLIKRCRPYVQEARVHNEAEALEADRIVKQVVGNFWLEINGDDEGFAHLRTEAIKLLYNRLR